MHGKHLRILPIIFWAITGVRTTEKLWRTWWRNIKYLVSLLLVCSLASTSRLTFISEANMTIKLHFLFSHLDWFPDNLGAESDEQGERFHQEMQEIEFRYRGYWDVSMIADYCWFLKREDDSSTKKRSTKKSRN